PAVVLEPRAHARCVIELFPGVLPDVADVEVAGLPVEREAPGIAQPVADDLRTRPARLQVHPQQLAEARAEILGAVLGIASRAAVAHSNVEVAVRPERKLTPF